MKTIIINRNKSNRDICLFEDMKMVEHYREGSDIQRLEGNIYLGKVNNILKGLGSAFINIGEEKNAFIHITNIIEKQDKITGNKNIDFSKYDVSKLLKVNDPILVQVRKDEENQKGVIVTKNINLTGRFLVLMTNVEFNTISSKIENEEEKTRLKEIAKELEKNAKKDYPDLKFGLIVRTSAANQSKEVLEQDLNRLLKLWTSIKEEEQKNLNENNFPVLIYENNDILIKFLVGVIDTGIDKIIVNTKKDEKEIKELLSILDKEDIEVELDAKNEKMNQVYKYDEEIEKLNNRKIWLKCGGFITIDHTEALTAIDVNSGKYIGTKTKDKEDTILKVNTEASIEIARQLKLRNISGIIIIDYINMNDKESIKKIDKILQNELKKDRSKTQIVGFTKLNLLEMTRKRI